MASLPSIVSTVPFSLMPSENLLRVHSLSSSMLGDVVVLGDGGR